MTPRAPWPRRLEWRAVRDRVRLMEIITDDTGSHETSRLDLDPREAATLLQQDLQHQLLHAVFRADQHGKPANDVPARPPRRIGL